MTGRRFFFTAMAALAGSLPLFAQQPQGAKAELRLLAFDPAMAAAEVFLQDPAAPADTPAVKTELKTYLNHEFAAISLVSRKVMITAKSDRASLTREGELLGEVSLPAGGDSAILMMLPGKPGSKAKFQVMTVPDAKKVFPSGSLDIINLSPTGLRLKLEQKVFDLKAGQVTLIENPPVREGGMIGMRAATMKDGAWTEIATSLWPHPGEGRVLMIVFQDPKSNQIRLKGFDDVAPRIPAAPATSATP